MPHPSDFFYDKDGDQKKKYRLKEIKTDEVSFVPAGANRETNWIFMKTKVGITKPGWDETDNEYRYRIRDPKDFRADTFKTKELTGGGAKGIYIVVGKLNEDKVAEGGNADSMVVQALRFRKDAEWDLDKAKTWLKDHPDIAKKNTILDPADGGAGDPDNGKGDEGVDKNAPFEKILTRIADTFESFQQLITKQAEGVDKGAVETIALSVVKAELGEYTDRLKSIETGLTELKGLGQSLNDLVAKVDVLSGSVGSMSELAGQVTRMSDIIDGLQGNLKKQRGQIQKMAVVPNFSGGGTQEGIKKTEPSKSAWGSTDLASELEAEEAAKR